MNDFDKMLNLDPLLEAEKMTGKSYKEDEETSRIGFGLHLFHAQAKKAELSLRDDTYHGAPFDTTLRIYADLGFKVIHSHTFPATYYDRDELFVVLWREDGVLAKAESYGDDSTNQSDIYYNWEHPVDEDGWNYTSSGSYHTPSYDAGRRVWVGHHDVREGIRHTLGNLEASGKFLNPWVEQPFLWLLDYSQTRDEDYDYKSITGEVVSLLPTHVKKAILA